MIRREDRNPAELEAERQAALQLSRVLKLMVVVVVAYCARWMVPELLITRGIMLRTSGLNVAAVAAYGHATSRLFPQTARGRAFLGKGKALAELGLRTEAVDAMEQAFALGAEGADAKHMLSAWRGGDTSAALSASDEHKSVHSCVTVDRPPDR